MGGCCKQGEHPSRGERREQTGGRTQEPRLVTIVRDFRNQKSQGSLKPGTETDGSRSQEKELNLIPGSAQRIGSSRGGEELGEV